MTRQEILTQIEKLDKGINNSLVADSLKSQMKDKKAELQKQLDELKKIEQAERKEKSYEQVLEKANKIIASKTASKTVKNTAKKKNDIKKIADELMDIDASVWNLRGINSGGELRKDFVMQGHYGTSLKSKGVDDICSKLDEKEIKDLVDILEDNNYHALNNYIGLKGFYKNNYYYNKDAIKNGYVLNPDAIVPKGSNIENVVNKRIETLDTTNKKIAEAKTTKTVTEKKKKSVAKKTAVAKKQAVKNNVKKTIAEAKSILDSLPKKVKEFNKGRSQEDIADDARKKALPRGKRISADGNVYYENRANRSDVSTKRKPYLEQGGEIKFDYYDIYASANREGYDLYNTEGDEDTDIFIGNYSTIDEAEKVANEKGLQRRPLYMKYKKGGKLSNKGAYLNDPQSKTYTRYEDSKESNRAKPAGWRYTNAGAKRLKLKNPNQLVAKAHLERYRDRYFTDSKGVKHRYIYIERRADKSDVKRGFPFLEKGGSIPNNYKGKTPEQVWNEWSVEQRGHFISDHLGIFGDAKKGISQYRYDELPNDSAASPSLKYLKERLEQHISEGQYEKGGELPKELYVKVMFDNPKYNYTTSINKSISDDEIRDYFKIGRYFNVGVGGNDDMQPIKDIEIVREYAKGGLFGESQYNTGRSWHQDRAKHNKSEHWEKPLSERKGYEDGGELSNMEISETALKVYVKPSKKEGKALFKQGDAICVVYDDGNTDWVGENDILKMEEGSIDAELPIDELQSQNIDVFGYETQNFDVSEHASSEFLKAISELSDESDFAKESLSKAAKHLDSILLKVKLKEEALSDVAERGMIKTILNDVQLFGYNNYESGLKISIDLISNICADIFELDIDSSNVYEYGGKMYGLGGLTVGNWYRDSSGEELRYIGKNDVTGELIFSDGTKRITRTEQDFEGKKPKESKLFGWFEDGGSIEKGNYEMLMSNVKAIKHHVAELENIVKADSEIEAWVVSKSERAATDLSDITHYLDGAEFECGGEMYAKGGKAIKEIDLPNSNLYLYGFGRDTNGNSTIKVGIGGNRPFSIQINNPEFYVHTYNKRGYKLNELEEGDILGIEKELVEYLKENGTKEQKSKLKIYSNFEKGGKTTFNDKVKAIANNLEGEKVKPKYQKEYGKKYDKDEAIEAATKIAGAMASKRKMKKGAKA